MAVSPTILSFVWSKPTHLRIPDKLMIKIKLINPEILIFSLYDTEASWFYDLAQMGYNIIHNFASKNNRLLIYSTMNYEILSSTTWTPNFKCDDTGIIAIIELVKGHRLGVATMDIYNKSIYKGLVQNMIYNPPMEYCLLLARFVLSPVNCHPDDAIYGSDVCFTDIEKLRPDEMYEGVYNQGIQFAPTCYLSPSRGVNENHSLMFKPISINNSDEIEMYSPVHQTRVSDFDGYRINWCDRIFYAQFQRSYQIKFICNDYDRIDDPESTLINSDHAVVYSVHVFE